MMKFKAHAILLSYALLIFGCGDDSTPSTAGKSEGPAKPGSSEQSEEVDPGKTPSEESPAKPGAEDGAQIKTSARNLLQWKRVAALEADLMRALELDKDQVCTELNGQLCTRSVHLVTLGGNDPYKARLDEPSREPLATTATVVDRVLLSACSTRADLDAKGDPKVFTALDLNDDAPKATASETVETIETLYRRLLRRDPLQDEVSTVATLVVDKDDEPVSAREFASAACFAIGSTTEFLFF